MRVLVCGSRGWQDVHAIRRRLLELPPATTILHGGARGADRLAAFFAERDGLFVEDPYLPDWDQHGKRAGIVRNLQMLDEKPDLVIAFWDGKSRGTKHTIEEARRRGIPVEVIQ